MGKSKSTTQSKWRDEYYIVIYRLAVIGYKNTQIAPALKVHIQTFNGWMKKYPAIKYALKKARDKENPHTFYDFVFERLPEKLQKLFDKVKEAENSKTPQEDVKRLLQNKGRRITQYLFIHALLRNAFNVSSACTFVGVSVRVFKGWMEKDLEFREMMEDVNDYKKDFYESQLVYLTMRGDPTSIIFANKTINKDRGYGDKIEVEMSGTVNHTHTMINIEELDLPLNVQRQILEAHRANLAKKPKVIETTAVKK